MQLVLVQTINAQATVEDTLVNTMFSLGNLLNGLASSYPDNPDLATAAAATASAAIAIYDLISMSL